MSIFGKWTLPKVWLSTITIGLLFIGIAGITARAADNQKSAAQNFLQTATTSSTTVGTPLNFVGDAPIYNANSAFFVDTVQFSATSYTVDEGGNFAVITVTRNGDLSTVGTVDYGTSDAGAGPGFATGGATCTGNADYVVSSGTITFNPNVVFQTILVPICEDALIEGTESFNIFLTNPNGVLVGSPSAVPVNITDNDQAGPGTFQFGSATYNVGENGGNATLQVTRTGGSAGAATVTYTLANGTATGGASCGTAGVDYMNTPNTVTFAAGQTTANITVPICDDGITEGNETFTVTLTGTTAGTIGAPSTTTVTILDDEGNNPGTLQFSPTTYSVREGIGTVTLTVTRTGGTTGAVSAQVVLNNGTAVGGAACTAGVDYINQGFPRTLNFASGQTGTTATFAVTICSDNVDELDETFTATLVNPVGGVLIGANATATVTILDDENGVFQFNPTAYPVSESQGQVLITVTRNDLPGSGTIGRVSVDYTTATTANTAANGSSTASPIFAVGGASCATPNPEGNGTVDFINQSGTLNFDPGVVSQTFAITICNDTSFEINAETFRITLSNPQTLVGGIGNPLLGPNVTATVTITDDDTAQPGTFTVSAVPNPVNEGGTTTVRISRNGGRDTAVSLSLTFTNGTATGGSTCTAGELIILTLVLQLILVIISRVHPLSLMFRLRLAMMLYLNRMKHLPQIFQITPVEQLAHRPRLR